MVLKFLKNKRGSELVEKILKVAVSLSIGAVIIGTTWGIVDHYTNLESPSANLNVSKKKWKTFSERIFWDVSQLPLPKGRGL